MSAKRFTIDVPQQVLDDLRGRLERTRWSEDGSSSGWARGTDQAYMKGLVEHWRDEYDWREHEAALNRFDQYMTTIDGVGIHFVHQKGLGSRSVPLLMIHGWPDSFYRYHKVIPLLTDPTALGDGALSFDVVVPSIPGFGFSDRRALRSDVVAELFTKLMTEELGYERFVCAGGDLGFIIAKALAAQHPERLMAMHLTEVGYPDYTTDRSVLSPAEQAFATFIQEWWFKDGTYNMIQSTKPDSLGVGLNDSPAGLAAWFMNFAALGMTGEQVEDRIPRDELLTNIMIYWVTGTITSSLRMYYENAHGPPSVGAGTRSEVPAAVAHMPMDAPLPREWAERMVNVKHFTEMPRGGHFGAWEVPELFARDLRDSVSEILDRDQRKIRAADVVR